MTTTTASKPTTSGKANPFVKHRNIGIMAHIDAGKTTVTERILFLSEKIHRTGEVHDGEATMDFLEEERKRGITIQSAATQVDWKGFTVNIIDTPGHVDFTAEVERSLRVLDGAVAVFDGVHGVEAQSETVWRQADKYRVPRICFVNKLDRVGADFDYAVHTIRERLGARPAPVQIPIGKEGAFSGVIDIVRRKAWRFDEGDQGKAATEIPVPAELAAELERQRHLLCELAAESDEAVLDLFIEDESIDDELLLRGLRRATIAMAITPVVCGSALKHKGVRFLLDAVLDFLPSPLDIPPVQGEHPRSGEKLERRSDDAQPLCLMAFKTIAQPTGDLTFVRVYSGVLGKGSQLHNPRTRRNERIGRLVRVHANKQEPIDEIRAGDIGAVVGLKDTITGDTLCDQEQPIVLSKMSFPEAVISMSIEPVKNQDRDKLGEIIGRLMREDPTFRAQTNEETGDLVISGMGELHLEIVTNRIKNDFNCEVRTGKPKVAYRQRFAKPIETEARYIRQSGGRGQYAVIWVRFETHAEAGGEYEFVDAVKGGSVPREYIPAVEEGIGDMTRGGGRMGYPFIGVKATLFDGKSHDVDSSEQAFYAAGQLAFRQAIEGNTSVLEPIMKVEVRVPEDYLGAVVGDLNARRGEISEVDTMGNLRIVRGSVPIAEMFAYSSALRGATQGRGSYAMELLEYREVPRSIAEKLLTGAKD
jgi:elongation factor G